MKAILILALLSSVSAFASESHNPPIDVSVQTLFSITNDRDSIQDSLQLMIDAKGLAAGYFVKPDPKNNDRLENTFWMRDVEKQAGVALVEGQGHKVILLQGQLDRASQEGRFHLQYLANGLTNKYETCDFLLKKGDRGWYVKNAYNGQKVTNMKIITWSLGLTSLQGICAN